MNLFSHKKYFRYWFILHFKNPFVSMGAAMRSLALLGQFLHNMRAAIRSLALLGQFLHNMGAAIRSRALLGQFLHSMGAGVGKLWGNN